MNVKQTPKDTACEFKFHWSLSFYLMIIECVDRLKDTYVGFSKLSLVVVCRENNLQPYDLDELIAANEPMWISSRGIEV